MTTKDKLPVVPEADSFQYKHYVILKDKSLSDRFYLYLLMYEPAVMEKDKNGYVQASQKYGRNISRRVYTCDTGQEEWTFQASLSSSKLKYADLAATLLYHNFPMNFAEHNFEANPMPDDGVIPAASPQFPQIPNEHIFKFKHYYIVQDKSILEKYHLYLLAYEPVSVTVDNDTIISYNKYGRTIGHRVYTFEPGEEGWTYDSTHSSRYSNLTDALVYHNFAMDFEQISYPEKPLPKDGIVPAPEPQFPQIPYLHNYKYKHYYIAQSKTALERYYLYLTAYEPVVTGLYTQGISKDVLVAYQKYGTMIHCCRYTFDLGMEEWKENGSSQLMQSCKELEGALIYNNFDIDLGEKGIYEVCPLPDDGVVPALEPQFPTVPYKHNFRYKHYFILQDKVNLEKYRIYLLMYEPASLQIDQTSLGAEIVVPYHKYEERIHSCSYTYTVGDNDWAGLTSSLSSLPGQEEYGKTLIYNNFDLPIGKVHYKANALPEDGVIPALEPEFPAVLNLHEYQYKHYCMVQNKRTLEQYYLYLLKYEPVAWRVGASGDTANDMIYPYQQYGEKIYGKCYRYTIGEGEWELNNGYTTSLQRYRELTDAHFVYQWNEAVY